MPQISQFYGIIITMYYNDHVPPHFHARYAEYNAEYAIADGAPLAGKLPRRAETLVLDWATTGTANSTGGFSRGFAWSAAKLMETLIAVGMLARLDFSARNTASVVLAEASVRPASSSMI